MLSTSAVWWIFKLQFKLNNVRVRPPPQIQYEYLYCNSQIKFRKRPILRHKFVHSGGPYWISYLSITLIGEWIAIIFNRWISIQNDGYIIVHHVKMKIHVHSNKPSIEIKISKRLRKLANVTNPNIILSFYFFIFLKIMVKIYE